MKWNMNMTKRHGLKQNQQMKSYQIGNNTTHDSETEAEIEAIIY